MARNMSFALTTAQVENRTKDVTRRLNWRNLRPGDRFWACVKCQGLKKGEKVQRIALLECVSNTRVPLDSITADDVRREGFPEMTPAEFVAMFCKHMLVGPSDPVNRIVFKYVEGEPAQ
jgi:hypothetical protein